MIDCAIVLTVYNQPELTLACLESLARCWRNESHDALIIVDNGSDGATQTLLADWCAGHGAVPAKIMRLEPNQGFLAAANAGMKQAAAAAAPQSAVCLLSNDTLVTPGWLERMCSLLEKETSLGIVNPMSTTFGVHPRKGQSIDELAASLFSEGGGFSESAACVGFCMLIRKSVLDAVGYLDPVFADGYFEDTDLCRRAGNAGFGCAICREAYVWHKEHATFQDSRRQALFSRNREIFEKRWGKPRRQAVAVGGRESNDAGSAQKVISWCLDSARQGNWLWVIAPRRSRDRFAVLKRHGNIQVRADSGLPVILQLAWLLLVKRKKPITEIHFSKGLADEKEL